MDSTAAAREHFEKTYGDAPTAIIRIPGYVGLMGEHIDASHLPSLQVAVDHELAIAVALTDDAVVRVASPGFTEAIELSRDVAQPPTKGWGRNVTAALTRLRDLSPGSGARVALAGNFLSAAAFNPSPVVTLGLFAALSRVWDEALPRDVVAKRAADAERSLGMERGGAVQQLLSFAEPDAALRVDQKPLQRHAVPLPQGLAFVVASPLDQPPAEATLREAYNERVMGMRLATALLAERIGVDPEVPLRLNDVADADVAELLAEDLQHVTSIRVVSRLTRIPIGKIGRFSVGSWDIAREVPVRPIAIHLFEESARVAAAEQALVARDLGSFGKLLNESHDSLRDHVGYASPAIEAICTAMREAGAFGARLAGPEFGGHALAACPPDAVASVIAAAERASEGAIAFEVLPARGYSEA